jgi:hypothetical protein
LTEDRVVVINAVRLKGVGARGWLARKKSLKKGIDRRRRFEYSLTSAATKQTEKAAGGFGL